MAKMTISFVKGRGSVNHNNREFVTENVNKDRIQDNITYKKESLEDAYEKCFGDAVREYNENQKRADRKIKNYMEHIRNSKNGEKLFYENVVQVGNKQTCPVGSSQGETAKQILDAYMKDFEKNNPNLYVFNAVLHMDEATPHLHIDYIPIAEGYFNKKGVPTGLQKRNSLDKALKQQGIDGVANKVQNSTHAWQDREKKTIEKIMSGWNWDKAKENPLKREHRSVDAYKIECEIVHNEVKALPRQIESASVLFNKKKVTVEKDDLEKLEQRAKLSLIHEKASKEIEQNIRESIYDEYRTAANKSYEAEKIYNNLNAQREELDKQIASYKSLYNEQLNLSNELKVVKEENAKLKAETVSLKAELQAKNTTIEHQNDRISGLLSQIEQLKLSMDEKVNEVTERFNKRIEHIKKTMLEVVEAYKNVMGSVAYIKENFSIDDKLKNLCDAICDYSVNYLEKKGFKNVNYEPKLAKGIEEFIEPEYKSIVYIKGDGKRYGWYSSKDEGHVYLGAKAELGDLMKKYPNAKFSDPFEHVPELHAKGVAK